LKKEQGDREMITLTREQALLLLQNFSQIDGYLLGLKDTSAIMDMVHPSIDLLYKKLMEVEK